MNVTWDSLVITDMHLTKSIFLKSNFDMPIIRISYTICKENVEIGMVYVLNIYTVTGLILTVPSASYNQLIKNDLCHM